MNNAGYIRFTANKASLFWQDCAEGQPILR